MIDFSFRILALSVVLSLIVAALVLDGAQPAHGPADPAPHRQHGALCRGPGGRQPHRAPSRRGDEIGMSERQLEHLQRSSPACSTRKAAWPRWGSRSAR
jgi:hypothetical protein